MKFKSVFLMVVTIFSLLASCAKKPNAPDDDHLTGDSRPVGPLRIVDSQIKTETRYRLDTSDLLEKID